jgi:hypothetical protein
VRSPHHKSSALPRAGATMNKDSKVTKDEMRSTRSMHVR